MVPPFLLFFVAFSPPPTTIVVALDGRADFRSVQPAVDSLGPAGGVIAIRPGVYLEKVVIDKPNVQLRGMGKAPHQVVLSWDLNAAAAGGTFQSASVTVTGDDFYAENLTFENTYGRSHELKAEGSQAVALRVTGDRAVFRRVRFLGHQDTLYATTAGCMKSEAACRPARQYFVDCYIEGNVDFIFGDALAYFDNCEIHSLKNSFVAITAQSKIRENEKSGYVFHRCRLTAEPGTARVYLGRPWRAYASVVFLECDMGPEIAPAGWLEWEHDGKPSLPTASYGEFDSRGVGANRGARRQLTAKEAAAFSRMSLFGGWAPPGIQ